ncbi:MAG: DegT/DnrJ/EryC1/StrS family aminotransferase [Proteobacteria bacterium]|nr:DegT/DnrJ/EryC1/StrS family aminotransferase [Pseudomonadota bacterium]
MNVPLLDLRPQLTALRPQILEAVTRVIDSTGYILGPEVSSLEQKIAQYCGAGYGVGLSSGTDALLVALMSLETGPGDLVLTTPYTFFATMGTILRVGAQPLFVDIEPKSFNIDPEQVAQALADDRKNGSRIKAIIPVHLYGQCADMQRLMALATEYDIPVIEDAAQAIGAECPYQEDGAVTWRRAGSMGLCGCFSFFPSKNLGGIGDGGMLTSSARHFVEIVQSNRNHGAEPKYYHSRVGGNFRLDPIQAAVLAVKLEYLDSWHAARRRNADRYRQLFNEAGLAENVVALPQAVYADASGADDHNHHIYNQFVILVPERDRLRQHLQEHAVGCEIYYPLCLHQQECLGPSLYQRQSLPVAEQAAASSLALPIYPELADEQLVYVVETIRRFYQTR